MSFFDPGTFHDRSQNRKIEDLERKAQAQKNTRRRASADRKDLENQIGELKLLCRALIATLKETGALDAELFEEHMKRIDAEDGTIDGKVTPPIKAPKVFKKRGRRWSS